MGARGNYALVVEDDEEIAEIMSQVLERVGYEVIGAEGGAEALAFLERVSERCLVILDLQVTDMNGWEVLAALRAAQRAHHPVLIVSGVAPEQSPRGVPSLRKPFSARQLLAAIDSAWAHGLVALSAS